ncbi:hypothetical protein [Shinella kummerowiae]|uniref:hypothetical protein n=1 Tax=Shinella kummerowiae TaxID=417745 RepID=UPI0021B50297|nr:hypothetical protein [Shinella kummerowiae]MCT7662355.1 hypothetical protein [Shinella kummerowiae]
MTTALTDNPAVTEPRKHLTPSMRTALIAIDHYRHQKRNGPEIIVGRHRFKASTVDALKRMELVRGSVPSLAPTLGGQMAVTRLKGEQS